ncbi:inositol polyphosphate multikinase beta [Andrographis paniculata]|uniref:inositol polyphosphate multikinase beta n=1 Tax=Andrographis paniculata TaxID=175694 RepID=UPI0021E94EDA|nr:inositol polyphosphate multikinase beta [Andrographis paniculata]XP_051148047.1 inositol polyphosphate multikinase beta [Andrographis paniculata]XP_051148048.1 inositol polyphosphate multikinase beta [Andrographis paniculata]
MLKAPEHQVGGHHAKAGQLGPLTDDSGKFYKPLQGDERGSNEVSFYTSFYSNTKVPKCITRFFPKFYGTQLVEASDGSGVKPHLVLEDLTFGMVNPSIMDVKIGSRTWHPQSPENYFKKCFDKDKATTSLSLGFRFSGMQIFDTKESGSWKPKRAMVQTLSANEVSLVLKKFVSSNASEPLNSNDDCAFASAVYGGPNGVLSQLIELKSWFENQTVYHFYSCSILVMFEKERAVNGENLSPVIKLIDFAHVYEGNGVIDHNFLGGLCSLIKFVSDIVTAADDFLDDARSLKALDNGACA